MRKPFVAPEYMPGEFNHQWIGRIVEAFEQWANQPAHLTATPQPEQPAAGDDVRELLAEKAYADGYEFFRNKWIGDHIEMNADLVEQFIPRTGISDIIAKQVVPDGEVPDYHNGMMGITTAEALRRRGFLIIRAPQL